MTTPPIADVSAVIEQHSWLQQAAYEYALERPEEFDTWTYFRLAQSGADAVEMQVTSLGTITCVLRATTESVWIAWTVSVCDLEQILYNTRV